MAAEYQEVLQWLFNMGLLPEGSWIRQVTEDHNFTASSYINKPSFECEYTCLPYPYRVLHNYYMRQRHKFFDINTEYRRLKTNSCKLLYIDTFIEKECNSAVLRAEWKKGVGDGLYPPPSLQAMLRTLLVPDVPIENKYILFVYLFLDLNMALNEDERYLQNLYFVF